MFLYALKVGRTKMYCWLGDLIIKMYIVIYTHRIAFTNISTMVFLRIIYMHIYYKIKSGLWFEYILMYRMICWFLIATIIAAPSCFIDRSYTSYLSLICLPIFAYLSSNTKNAQNMSNSSEYLYIPKMKLEKEVGNLNNRSLLIIMSFYFPPLQPLQWPVLNIHY